MTSVDIVLPYYNGSRFIKEQIDSIRQSDLDGIQIRLIVVNDCSKPSDTELIRTLLTTTDLYLENEKNLGVIKSVEKGLKAATAPYIMLCDHDDFWLPQKIKNSLKRLKETEKNSPALVYTDLIISGPKLELLQPSMLAYYNYQHAEANPSILFMNMVTGCTVIMNRKLVEFSLPFPVQLTMHDHWLALCAVFYGKLELLNEPTILYRQHGSNQIGAAQKNVLAKIVKLKTTAQKFNQQLTLKLKMAEALVARLNEQDKREEARQVTEIIQAFATRNIPYLLRKNVIKGNLVNKLGASVFMLFRKQ